MQCKSPECGEEFDIEFYQGEPPRIVECWDCGARHRVSWMGPNNIGGFKSELYQNEEFDLSGLVQDAKGRARLMTDEEIAYRQAAIALLVEAIRDGADIEQLGARSKKGLADKAIYLGVQPQHVQISMKTIDDLIDAALTILA